MSIYAAKAAKEGKSLEEILNIADEVNENSHLFASIPSLKYLSMSGRVSDITAGMASLLSIKPILSIKDGKLDMVEKIRTDKKALRRLVALSQEKVGDKKVKDFALLHVVAEEKANLLEEMLREAIPGLPDKPYYCSLSPGLSVHAGSGLVGVVLYTEYITKI